MLRRTFLYLSQQKWLRGWMEQSPLSRRFTSRFVAGGTLAQVIHVAGNLSREGITSSLDFLGENVTSIEAAAHSLDIYLDALNEIEKAGLSATVSIKLTQFGLDLSAEECGTNVSTLVDRARRMGTRVEIDMESSAYTERTLDIVSALHQRFPGSVRAVIQAYLYRSEADIARLSQMGIPVRLCKGAYNEPSSAAFPEKRDVDTNYLKLIKQLLDSGVYPAVASHDEVIVKEVVRYVQQKKLPPDRFEFQMLYGIRRDLQRQLISSGYRLRLYVPYGDAWYPYFMRRLAERPANVLFVAKNLLRS